MTRPRRSHLAVRTIPVAVAAPVQLSLPLLWSDPIDHVHAEPQPPRLLQIARAA